VYFVAAGGVAQHFAPVGLDNDPLGRFLLFGNGGLQLSATSDGDVVWEPDIGLITNYQKWQYV